MREARCELVCRLSFVVCAKDRLRSGSELVMTCPDFGKLVALLVCLICACSGGSSSDLRVGAEPGGKGGGSAGTNAAGGGAGAGMGSDKTLGVEVEDIDKTRLEIITVACSGECADVEAIAHGGNPPYAFRWDDGSTDPRRHVCPAATTQLSVSVTDTAVDADEFQYEAQTASAEVTAQVLDCGDAGSCDRAGGGAIPESGHYVGTLACANGEHLSDPQAADGGPPTTGTLTLNLDVDPSTTEQGGDLYFEWVLHVIGGVGTIKGVLDCSSGELVASYTGNWGLPVLSDPNDPMSPMTVLSTGPLTGDLTVRAVPGTPGKIEGTLYWFAPPVTAMDKPSECHGTFSAELQP